jgi:hypothetical protein
MARPTPQQAAEQLLGTAMTLDEVVGEHFDTLPREWCHTLDTHVMCCEACGWWVESDDVDEDGNCSDCSEV